MPEHNPVERARETIADDSIPRSISNYFGSSQGSRQGGRMLLVEGPSIGHSIRGMIKTIITGIIFIGIVLTSFAVCPDFKVAKFTSMQTPINSHMIKANNMVLAVGSFKKGQI